MSQQRTLAALSLLGILALPYNVGGAWKAASNPDQKDKPNILERQKGCKSPPGTRWEGHWLGLCKMILPDTKHNVHIHGMWPRPVCQFHNKGVQLALFLEDMHTQSQC
jgi:hypothetical protein